MLLVYCCASLVASAFAAPYRASGYSPDPAWLPATPKNVSGVSSCAVGIGTDTALYVGQRGHSAGMGAPIQVLDGKTGKFLRSFGSGFKTVHGMHMQVHGGSEFLWVTDAGAGKISKFDAHTGKLLATLGSHGTAISPVQFGSVADIAFDAAGAIYISDGDGGCNALILKLDGTTMKVLWAVGNNGTVPNQTPFKSPHSLAYCAKTDTVFVADRNNNHLRSFDAKTGAESSGSWSSVFASAQCSKPSVWSVRIDDVTSQVGVRFPSLSSPPAAAHAPIFLPPPPYY